MEEKNGGLMDLGIEKTVQQYLILRGIQDGI
jgi:hypothetical protein